MNHFNQIRILQSCRLDLNLKRISYTITAKEIGVGLGRLGLI